MVEAKDVGLSRPVGLAYDPVRKVFFVAAEGDGGTTILRLSRLAESLGTSDLPEVTDASTLTFDAVEDRLVVLDDGELLSVNGGGLASGETAVEREAVPDVVAEAGSLSIDPESGTFYVLDRETGSVVTVDPEEPTDQSVLKISEAGDAGLLAFNQSDGLLYVLDGTTGRLDSIDADGATVASYDLSGVDLTSPEAMTFAPSTDTTDDPASLNLFVADSGGDVSLGGVVEVSLEQTSLVAASVVTATHIQTIATSDWSPPSTDPSGIVWNPNRGELIVADSEINEIPLFQNVNMWFVNRSGTVLRTGATFGPLSAGSYSDEPTGLGFDPATNTLFVSDDTGTRSVYVVRPGSDGLLGTADDEVNQINMGLYGASDTEDPEFDPVSGHLFVLSGTDREVFRINPVDGIFGNGNDVVTSFDISHLGPTDFEGMTASPSKRTLYIGARSTKQIFEVTHTGTLVRTINVSISGHRFISGLAMAPSSVNPSVKSLWIVDRGVDEVNDGRIYEIGVPDLDDTVGNTPPVVNAGPDQTVVFPNQATLAGSVSDDGLPANGQLVSNWSKESGPGTVTFANAASPSTTAGFSEAGVYVLRLTASDGELSASDDVTITVQASQNSSPTIDPIDDVSVAEGNTVVVPVSVSDPDGDPLTVTVTGLPAFASFDESTLQITFSPQAGHAGTYGPITVTVSDGDSQGGGAPEFRSAASAAVTGASGSTLTIPRPTGVQEGDLLIAQIRYRGATPNLTAPAGWTSLGIIADSSNANHSVLYKFAGPSEPLSYTFNQNVDEGRISGGIGAYSGVNPSSPINAWAASTARTATLEAPNVNSTVANTRVLRLWGWRGSSADGAGVGFNLPPAGITQRWSEQLGHVNSDRNRVLAGDAVKTTAGPVGTATASGSQSTDERNRSSFTVVLAPGGGSGGNTASTSFNLTVTPATGNTSPVAVNDTASTTAGTPVAINVLANDTDADGDTLSVVNLTSPSDGSVVLNANQTVTYTPSAGFTGTDTFTYRAFDGLATSNVATVTVTVTDLLLEQFALTSVSTIGSVSGSLANTQESNNTYLRLTERHSGGKPELRTSQLEHQFSFVVRPGDDVTFVVEARRTDNSENDNFQFSYSTNDGVTFQPLVLVTATADTVYQAALPPRMSGTIIVRVVDTDRTPGNGFTDSLFIDYMAVRTLNPR